jgi:hypothetical protein
MAVCIRVAMRVWNCPEVGRVKYGVALPIRFSYSAGPTPEIYCNMMSDVETWRLNSKSVLKNRHNQVYVQQNAFCDAVGRTSRVYGQVRGLEARAPSIPASDWAVRTCTVIDDSLSPIDCSDAKR